MSDPVKVPVSMTTPVGTLEIELITTVESVPAEQVFPSAAMLADAVVETAVKMVEKGGHTIQCRRGCDACCCQLVPVAPVEALALTDALEAMETEQRARVEQRFVDLKARVQEAGLVPELEDMMAERGGRGALASYFGLGQSCPFLEDGACSVYEARPMACRELLVVSDPKHCDQGASPEIKRIPMLIEMSRVMYKLSSSIWADEPSRMPLIWAVDWAREQRSRATMKARGVDVVRGMLDLVGRQLR